MSEPIKGKVARILNSRELILNVGTKRGVRVGQYFDILAAEGEDVRDPDTGELLGSIARPKVRVKIIKADENLSIASTYKKSRINIGGEGLTDGGWARMLLPPKYITRVETLKTSEDTWESLPAEKSLVNIGDPAVQITGSAAVDIADADE